MPGNTTEKRKTGEEKKKNVRKYLFASEKTRKSKTEFELACQTMQKLFVTHFVLNITQAFEVIGVCLGPQNACGGTRGYTAFDDRMRTDETYYLV